MLPALQPDAGHPTAALAHRRSESSGKIFAGSHWNAPRKAHRHEDLTAPQAVQTEPGFVVLGEAFGVENSSVSRACQTFQRRPVKAGPHTVRGQKSTQALADWNVFVLV